MGAVIYKGYGFFFYENIKSHFLDNSIIKNRPILLFISGSMAGVFAQFLSYPFDVIKKKLQATQDNKTQ
jgi:hypothetical protein